MKKMVLSMFLSLVSVCSFSQKVNNADNLMFQV